MAKFIDEVNRFLGLKSIAGASFTIEIGTSFKDGGRADCFKNLRKLRRSKGVSRVYLKIRKNEILLKVIFAKDAK